MNENFSGRAMIERSAKAMKEICKPLKKMEEKNRAIIQKELRKIIKKLEKYGEGEFCECKHDYKPGAVIRLKKLSPPICYQCNKLIDFTRQR